jgi:hypothetical protein
MTDVSSEPIQVDGGTSRVIHVQAGQAIAGLTDATPTDDPIASATFVIDVDSTVASLAAGADGLSGDITTTGLGGTINVSGTGTTVSGLSVPGVPIAVVVSEVAPPPPTPTGAFIIDGALDPEPVPGS